MTNRYLLTAIALLLSFSAMAETIVVKNIEELKAANKKAQPGDIVILKNGEWKNVTIQLDCHGTQEKPITFKAETAGKLLITGQSKLKLGGTFIIVNGLYFTNGYAGKDAVISFRIDSNTLANDCRVTNTTINDFNNPKRMDENNWVLLYGKNNRLDHCSFKDKKNMGVLLAVILDDDRSRENFHSIDRNYFGRRPPLGSNGGEIIRVGVSQHCQFNSNTQIIDNFFEHCDGETEIVSIKSCKNTIDNNVFKECQGSVVLRHGDYNVVLGNYFLGNDKKATGGVRVINKGQSVVNNVFFKCRGTDFRSPLAIMNGIPNSPAHRYVQVTDAEIANNSFYECAPLSFCEGSDTERTLPPDGVRFSRNIFYNTRDSILYKAYDDMSGFQFKENKVNRQFKAGLPEGFIKTDIPPQKISTATGIVPEHPNVNIIALVERRTYNSSGAAWFPKKEPTSPNISKTVNCATAEEVYQQLERPEPVNIRLTGKNYTLTKPFLIAKPVQVTSNPKTEVKFNTGEMLAVFQLAGNGHLTMHRLDINGAAVNAKHFISSDSTGSSAHYNLEMNFCRIAAFGNGTKCEDIFYAYKSMIADSIVFRSTTFYKNTANGIVMTGEKDDKGYYNAEKIIVQGNKFVEQLGILADIYRGGNDESTLGPQFTFSDNRLTGCVSSVGPLISLNGVQVTAINNNYFQNCNQGKTLISYSDKVRARHLLEKNTLINSGRIAVNNFLVQKNNNIK